MRTPRFFKKVTRSRRNSAADLQTQMESLLDSVWLAERNWRLMDRIDLAVAAEEQRELQRRRLSRKQ